MALAAVALGSSACADGVPIVSEAMKPRTAADVVVEQLGPEAEVLGISGQGPGHAWYERVADGSASVTFARDGRFCVGLGRIDDGEESSEIDCVAPVEEIEAPVEADIELEGASVWQVPTDAGAVTVVRPDAEYVTRATRAAGAAWIVDGFGSGITHVRLAGG